MADEQESSPKKQVGFLTALVTLLILVAGAAYQFGIKEATIEQKLEAAKKREEQLLEELERAKATRAGYERQWLLHRPPASKK